MESTLVSKHRDDLKSSGLSDNTITLSNIYSASIEEVVKLGFSHRSPAMAIPYHDGSVRLKPDIPFINKKGKPAKYLTLKDGKIILYIPPNFNKSNLQDSSIPLVITEGEKKTLKSNQEGIPTVGLSGVWNFASDGVTIPDLMNIKWCGRLVYICFDSDAVLKWEILMAEWTLGRWLESKDATVRIIRLPSILGSAKTGLDDYLIKRTKKDFEQLQQESKGIDFFFQKPNEVLRALLDGIKYEIYSYEKEKDGVRATLSILDLKTGNPIFKDSLPLWSAKKRTEFANKNKELGYADVDKHLTVIEEQLKIFTPIDDLKNMTVTQVTKRFGNEAWPGFVQGYKVQLEMEKTNQQGGNNLILGTILKEYFSSLVNWNSFVMCSLSDGNNKGEWMQWQPQPGAQAQL